MNSRTDQVAVTGSAVHGAAGEHRLHLPVALGEGVAGVKVGVPRCVQHSQPDPAGLEHLAVGGRLDSGHPGAGRGELRPTAGSLFGQQ